MKVGLIGFAVGFITPMALFWYAGVDFGQRHPMPAFCIGIALICGVFMGLVFDHMKRLAK